LQSHSAPAEDPTAKVWFSAKSAASYLDFEDEKTVRRAALAGRLQHVRTAPATPGARGGNLRFRKEWLDRFAQGLPPLDAEPSPMHSRRKSA
jgi:hypothetical protein